MTNYPEPRDIPAGKVLITPFGYSPPREEYAVVEPVANFMCNHVAIRARVRLEWSSPGWELAGSAMRWTNGYWAVRWEDRSGCTQGKRYLNESEARAHFSKLQSMEE